MNILLINPPCREPYAIPLGLGYIASVLRDTGHQVEVLDVNGFGYSQEEVIDRLDGAHFDCAGIGGLSTTYSYVKWIAAQIKKLKPGTPIIAGNMVSTANPSFLLEKTDVDIAVFDEGEITCLELMQAFAGKKLLSQIDGIFYKENGNIHKNPARKRIEDLDCLPFPAWDLFPMDIYVKNSDYYTYGLKSATISSARGCPYGCVYCSRPFGQKVTYRSAVSIVREIKELNKRYGIRHLTFADNLFLSSRKRAYDLCHEILKERLDVQWSATGRVNLAEKDILRTLKKAGCIAIDYGFESGSQNILDIMKKGVTVKQAEDAVRITRKVGLKILESFMFGMIGETRETIDETVDFITRMRLQTDRLFFTTPYPGTPLYQMAKDMGRLPVDEEKYMLSLNEMTKTMIVNLTEFSDETLIELKKKTETRIKAQRSLYLKIKLFLIEWRRRWRVVLSIYKCNGARSAFKHLIFKLLKLTFSFYKRGIS